MVLTAVVLLLGCVSAQNVTVWSSFAYVFHGDRTPLQAAGAPFLTPLGAQQLFQQGSLFRDRYLSSEEATGSVPIRGLKRDALDNSQVSILSTTESFVGASALAFLQGLYPPKTGSHDRGSHNGSGRLDAALLSNGSTVDYPLGGYQYPNVRTLSSLDPNSIWVSGHSSCTRYWESSEDLSKDDGVAPLWNSSRETFLSVFARVFPDARDRSNIGFDLAYDVYDFTSFQYNHNSTVRSLISSEDMATLRNLANAREFYQNGNLSAHGNQAGDMIRAVAGRTLAATIVAQLRHHLFSSGDSAKLSLMFGSHQPMMALFALTNLTDGRSAELFRAVPPYGSAILFELFTNGSVNATDSGTTNGTSTTNNVTTDNAYHHQHGHDRGPEDLWVRFLYVNGTAATTTDDRANSTNARLMEYPVFGRGETELHLRWRDFQVAMSRISIADLAEWCSTCEPVSLFCNSLQQNSAGDDQDSYNVVLPPTETHAVSPAVAGLIGGALTLVGTALLTAAVMILGGFGIHRRQRAGSDALAGAAGAAGARGRSPTGFRGAEKHDDDQDISIARNGARHARVGSWELGSHASTVVGADADADAAKRSSAGSGFGPWRARADDVDADVATIAGGSPVKPRETL